jgi:hypothetical protein
MIAVVITFPGIVMHYKGPAVDTSNFEMKLPDMQGLGGELGGGFGLPAPGAPGGLGGLPPLGSPPVVPGN